MTSEPDARARLHAMFNLSETDEAELNARIDAVVAAETAALRTQVAELEARPEYPDVVEYGTAFKATDQDEVEVHTPTSSREESAARVSRYLDMYPTAHLVQRAVRYGEWTEVTP